VLDPFLRGSLFSSFSPGGYDSWFQRVRENLKQLFTTVGLSPSSANGAPIHLLKVRRTPAERRAQAVSAITHAGIVAAIVVFVVPTGTRTGPTDAGMDPRTWPHHIFTPLRHAALVEEPSLGSQGGGGDNDPLPPRRGFFAPSSPIQLAPPRLPDDRNHQLPVPNVILDPQVPPEFKSESYIGLPWMPKDTRSAGPGEDGVGGHGRGGMGDHDGPGGGEGVGGPYAVGTSAPVCAYCPDPLYTDEARQVKVQGTVMLRVLVGSDGRAEDIRIVKGVGYGLEERAAQTIRGWKFKPARDASQRPVAAWVTIETVFRLF
jgi:periplasmic protein TonB